MAFDQTFAAAYIDNGTRHRVLGARLRPFSAWHLFLLEVAESPFLNAGDAYLFHLRRAVGICRLRFPETKLKLPWSPLIVTQKKLHAEVGKFLLYTGDYIHKPEYTIIPFNIWGKDRAPGPEPKPPPGVIQLVYDAARGANVPIDVAWNMPIGQTYISQAMYYQSKGVQVDFMDDKEREFQAAIKEHMRAQKNGEE